ncbi:MAG: lecithin retinol acyltransferase family protein [Candidatus Cloacimonetes bacterium]|nr:lecithin retinol acyltransferase family protein [Candidatus Cloacimonadota bacterium]
MNREIINHLHFDEEQWEKNPPQPADHIKTPRAGGIYTHHGIYISDGEVIHFASEDSDNLTGAGNEIINTDLKTFLRGGELFVRIYNTEEQSRLFDKDAIISYARSCVGDAGYNLVFNNCEHFCNECTFAEHRSTQVDAVIKPMEKGDDKMGLLEKVGNLIEKVNTKRRILEEPSKVEIAQIEKMKAIELAEIEKEKIVLSAELEGKLNEFNTKLAIQLMQAGSEEFVKLNQKMLEIAKEAQQMEIEKYQLFESASLEIREKIESYYKSFGKEIDEYEFDFIERRLPQLLKKLEEYQPGSGIYDNYEKSILHYKESFMDRIQTRIKMLHDNQRQLIQSSDATKEKILINSNKLIEKRMDILERAIQESQKIKLDFTSQKPQKRLADKHKEQDANEIRQIEARTESN